MNFLNKILTSEAAKIVFTGICTILIIPIIDTFKVENGIIRRELCKCNDSTLIQNIYVTKDYLKPVLIKATITDSSNGLLFEDNNAYTLYLQNEDNSEEFKRKLKIIKDSVFNPLVIKKSIGNLPKGLYTLHLTFREGTRIPDDFKRHILVDYASNQRSGQDAELINVVNYFILYHFFYFYKCITLILIFFFFLLFIFILKNNTDDKDN